MCSSHTKWLCLGAVVLAAACGEAPEYRFGENITGLQFELFDPTEENPAEPHYVLTVWGVGYKFREAEK